MSINNINYIVENFGVISIRKSYQRKSDMRDYHIQISDDLARKLKDLNEYATRYNKDALNVFEALFEFGVDKCIEITQRTIAKTDTLDNQKIFMTEIPEYDPSREFITMGAE
jgi:hypothetical protein